MSKQVATEQTGLSLEAVAAMMTEAVKTAVATVMPKNIQTASAEAFAKVDYPRPPIPTFQNGMPIDLRGVPEPQLSETMRKLGEIPSGVYLDGIIRVTRTDPTVNTEGRLDIRYDGSTTEKRLLYYSQVRDFHDMVERIWREAQKATKAA